MFASIASTRIDMDRSDEAFAGIEGVKARLQGLRGFERAYWMEPIDGGGLMISIWTDRDAASEAGPPVGFEPAPGVVVEKVEIREVIQRT